MHSCLWFYEMMTFVSRFLSFWERGACKKKSFTPYISVSPFPYLLSLSVKDENCEALFPLLVVAGLLGGMRSRCQEHLVMFVRGRQKPPRPRSLHLELSMVICSSAGKYEALRD